MLLIFLLLWSEAAWSSSCCGTGVSNPSLIIGLHELQAGMSYTRESVVGEVGRSKEAYFRAQDDDEDKDQLQFEAAMKFKDDFQASLQIPYVQKKRRTKDDKDGASGVGDPAFGLAYEFIASHAFSPWVPRGLAFVKLTFPVGASLYDEDTDGKSSRALGSGRYQAMLGALFIKSKEYFDLGGGVEAHASPERRKAPAVQGGSLSVNAGFSPWEEWRLSTSLAFKQDWVSETSGGHLRQTVWPWVFGTSYLLGKLWMASLTYTDETLMGPTENTLLTRSLTLTFQKRW